MRVLRSIFFFSLFLLLAGLIAVNIALAAREAPGPDLGGRADTVEALDGPEKAARLWYMRNALGRWGIDRDCQVKDETWLFARRRIVAGDGSGAQCRISQYVPGEPTGIIVDRCRIQSSARSAPTAFKRGENETLTLEIPKSRQLMITHNNEKILLKRCRAGSPN